MIDMGVCQDHEIDAPDVEAEVECAQVLGARIGTAPGTHQSTKAARRRFNQRAGTRDFAGAAER